MLLLVLSSAFGQAGILQCLCTGQVTFVSPAVEECTECCCEEHGEQAPQDGLPSPCDDGSCYLLISLDAVDTPVTSATFAAPLADVPTTTAELELIAPRVFSEMQAALHRPPDRQPVPLTVLFSSFLI